MARRYILTGAPGAGKTVILRALEAAGHAVVEEAATDVIAAARAAGEATPERRAGFIDDILALQRRRQVGAARGRAPLQFFDRSPICTHALCVFLGFPVPAALADEIARLRETGFYEGKVLFVRSLGFITPTAARRIGLADARRFEAVHEASYRAFGFDCAPIPPGPVVNRVAAVVRETGA